MRAALPGLLALLLIGCPSPSSSSPAPLPHDSASPTARLRPASPKLVDANSTAAPGEVDAAVLVARAGMVAFCRLRLSRTTWGDHKRAPHPALRSLRSVGVVLCALALTACATQHPHAAEASRSSAVVQIPQDANPTPAAADLLDASHVAEGALAAFCRSSLNGPAWIAGLDPFLTLRAASAYGTVDPARVPCHRVTGAAAGQVGDAFTRVVTVPTDAGAYAVTVNRTALTDAWRVSALVPAAAAP